MKSSLSDFASRVGTDRALLKNYMTYKAHGNRSGILVDTQDHVAIGSSDSRGRERIKVMKKDVFHRLAKKKSIFRKIKRASQNCFLPFIMSMLLSGFWYIHADMNSYLSTGYGIKFSGVIFCLEAIIGLVLVMACTSSMEARHMGALYMLMDKTIWLKYDENTNRPLAFSDFTPMDSRRFVEHVSILPGLRLTGLIYSLLLVDPTRSFWSLLGVLLLALYIIPITIMMMYLLGDSTLQTASRILVWPQFFWTKNPTDEDLKFIIKVYNALFERQTKERIFYLGVDSTFQWF